MKDCSHLSVEICDVKHLSHMGLLPSLSNCDDGPFSPSDVAAYACKAAYVDPEDIYTITRLVSDSDISFTTNRKVSSSYILVVPVHGCGISFSLKAVPLILIQQLLQWLSRSEFRTQKINAVTPASAIKPMPIGTQGGLIVWASDAETASTVLEGWSAIQSQARPLTEQEVMATPKLFGNKSRVAHQIAAIARSSYPEGSSVLDLMSGTGVVSRRLADSFVAYTNDGNPYGGFFARMQFASISADDVASILTKISIGMEKNRSILRGVLAHEIDVEAEFLHGSVNDDMVHRYNEYISICLSGKIGDFVASGKESHTAFPYCFATAYYANAYFGLSQAIDIDSIRYALDEFDLGYTRDALMGCLLAVASTVGSNLYFAQPPIVSTPTALKKVLRLRALDVFWEFAAQVKLLATRISTKYPIKESWTGDWRQALKLFAQATDGGGSRFIYVDPPYSKLQYSRYYHVLNVMAKYNYPVLADKGRYPSLAERFSSKFEHRPTSSLREFGELFAACAENNTGLILSYSDEAFVRPNELFGELVKYFRSIRIFTQQIRHSPPGSKISKKRRNVNEYIIDCHL